MPPRFAGPEDADDAPGLSDLTIAAMLDDYAERIGRWPAVRESIAKGLEAWEAKAPRRVEAWAKGAIKGRRRKTAGEASRGRRPTPVVPSKPRPRGRAIRLPGSTPSAPGVWYRDWGSEN